MIFTLSAFMTYGQCNKYFALGEGKELLYVLKDNRGKVKGYQGHKLEERKDDGTYEIETTIYNKRMRKDFDYDYEAVCEGDTLYVDGAMAINGLLMEDYAGAKIKSKNGEKMILPLHLEVGMELPDAEFIVITADRGFLSLDVGGFEVEITDRKVVGKETVTTPVGTYQCFKITNKTAFGFVIMFGTTTDVYYAPEIGIVKSVTYRHDHEINSMTLKEIK